MVLGVEVELHHRTDGRGHAIGLEGEVAVLVGDFDDVDGCGGGGGGCGSGCGGHF